MSENPCEFEKLCMPEENHQCADREHPGDCDTYHFAVRVHNQALVETKEQLMAWGMPEKTVERSVAPLRKEAVE